MRLGGLRILRPCIGPVDLPGMIDARALLKLLSFKPALVWIVLAHGGISAELVHVCILNHLLLGQVQLLHTDECKCKVTPSETSHENKRHG